MGARVSEFVTPADRHGFEEYLERIQDDRVDQGVLRFVTKRGDEVHWQYRSVVIRESDTVSYVLVHAQDVSDLARIRTELEVARRELTNQVAQQTAELSEANALLKKEIGERVRMEQSLRQSRTRLELVNAIGLGISSGMSFEGVIQQTVTQLVEAFPRARSCYASLGGDAEETIVSTAAPRGKSSRAAVPDWLLDLFVGLADGGPIIIENTAADSRLADRAPSLAQESICAALALYRSSSLTGRLASCG